MKKSGRKLLGVLLAASMTVAAVFPIQSVMAAETGREAEHVEKKESSEEKWMEETPEKVQQPAKQQEEAGSGVFEEIQMEETESVVPLSMEETEPVMPLSDGYDINQPVIERFELEENGRTLTEKDILHFKLWAYDADSDISSVYVEAGGRRIDLQKSEEEKLYTAEYPCSSFKNGTVSITEIRVEDRAKNYTEADVHDDNYNCLYYVIVQNTKPAEKVSVTDFQIQTSASGEDGALVPGDTVTCSARVTCENGKVRDGRMKIGTIGAKVYHTEEMSMTYNEESQTVTGIYTIKDTTYPSEWSWEYITVTTQSGKGSKVRPDKSLKFTVVQENFDLEDPVIESITLDKNGEMVTAGDKVTITVKVKEENPRSLGRVYYTSADDYRKKGYTSLYWKEELGAYQGIIPITKETYPGRWNITNLEVRDIHGHTTRLKDFQEDFETVYPWYYTVDPEGYHVDNQAPVIKSITLDKNNQWVQPGDTLTLTVKVEEEHPSRNGYAYFYPQVSNVSGYQYVDLQFHPDTMEYTGTIPITEDTYPCEWMMTDLRIEDQNGYRTNVSQYIEDWYATYPFYYRVKTRDTYREDYRDVTFTFYGLALQEDGSYQDYVAIPGPTVEKVGRRTTLKELGVSFPQAPEGVNATWMYGNRKIDEDTELLFGDRNHMNLTFYASYDKDCANVSLTYMTKDQGIKTAIVPVFVERETTYREVLEQLKLPEDASETGFSGFRLGEGYEENWQIWGTVRFSAEAEYNGCQVSWHTRYQGSNGMGAEKGVVKSYEKGMTVKDALAELEPPETVEGMEFEGWVLTKGTEDDILSSPMTELEVTAVYRGKTTVDVLYTYRGEDGKLATGNRLMFLNGENLSDAAVQGEATSVFKEVNHLKGLMLSEWEGDMEVNQGRYKSIRFRAKYYNCVVILKFPDESCQYIVVNRGARYTLPTENEKYTDLLWEGCEKGETVVITEDREFLACAGKLKDGTEEGPLGVKLPEEEISRIVAEIEQSGSGETITIDMKQATVVPKEVLEAIQGKEVQIVLDMGSYSWTIGGTEVAAAELKDIDLEVKADTGAVPTGLINELAEGKPTTQLTLTHNGEFGFRADLTLNMGSENSGGTGNLYYYDSAGKLIFRNAGQIGEDGNISLSFSHASDYVVVVDQPENGKDSARSEEKGEKTWKERENAEIKKKENPVTTDSGTDEDDSNSNKRKSPKTGE